MGINNKTDFTKTLNLPKETIAIKGNQVKKEDYILQKIQDNKKYQYVTQKNANSGGKKYIITDLPTSIEEKVSSTMIFNKILKDFAIKSKILNGDYVEHKLVFTSNSDMEQIDDLPKDKSNLQELIKSRQAKRKELDNVLTGQIYSVNNLGTTINYEKENFSTIKPQFEAEMIQKFLYMYKLNKIEKQLRPIHWCINCGKPKNKKDVKYVKKELDNYYILYRVEEDKDLFKKYDNLKNTYFVASTVRPWTMVTSENIAIAEDLEYSLVEVNVMNKKTHYIIASDYVDEVMKKEFYIKYSIKETFTAEKLKNILCMNPVDYRKRVNIIVTKKNKVSYSLEDSTGVRIVSSGHTYLDYLILKGTKPEAIKVIIDESGKTNNMATVFNNLDYKEVNTKIIEYLRNSNFIYSTQKTKIPVHTCDTCNEELIYRCISEWYAIKLKEDIITEEFANAVKEKIVSTNKYKNEEFIKGIDKINSIKQILISDKNIIGTPIPVFYCADCGASIIDDKTISIIAELFKTKGTDSWYKMSPEEMLQGQVSCKCGCGFFFKENATLNDFFKYICITLMQRESSVKNRLSTTICIEGKEQFLENIKALSFTDSLSEGVGKLEKLLIHSKVKEKVQSDDNNLEQNNKQKDKKKKPFKGKKADTSNIKIEGAVMDVVSNYGTDVLRLWVASSLNYNSINLNKQYIININRKYKNIRRTYKYILANLYDFNPTKDYMELSKRIDIDQYFYIKLTKLVENVKLGYESLKFNNVYNDLMNFCEKELCGKYFESIKYKLYIQSANSKERRSIQSNMYDIMLAISALWAPIIPFTLEELWPYMWHKSQEENRHLYTYRIKLNPLPENADELEKRWDKIFSVKARLDKKVKKAQVEKIIKSSLEGKVVINTNEFTKKFVEGNYDDILECVNVSSIEANVTQEHDVLIQKEPGTACARCGHYTIEIGKNIKYRYLCPKCADILIEAQG